VLVIPVAPTHCTYLQAERPHYRSSLKKVCTIRRTPASHRGRSHATWDDKPGQPPPGGAASGPPSIMTLTPCQLQEPVSRLHPSRDSLRVLADRRERHRLPQILMGGGQCTNARAGGPEKEYGAKNALGPELVEVVLLLAADQAQDQPSTRPDEGTSADAFAYVARSSAMDIQSGDQHRRYRNRLERALTDTVPDTLRHLEPQGIVVPPHHPADEDMLHLPLGGHPHRWPGLTSEVSCAASRTGISPSCAGRDSDKATRKAGRCCNGSLLAGYP
jgi:hypothetical protein